MTRRGSGRARDKYEGETPLAGRRYVLSRAAMQECIDCCFLYIDREKAREKERGRENSAGDGARKEGERSFLVLSSDVVLL